MIRLILMLRSGSSIEGFTIRYTGMNPDPDVEDRHYYIDIGNGSSNIGIDSCLIGRDGYVSGWSPSSSRYLATVDHNDGGIHVGQDCSNINITSCKIRYLAGPGIGIETGSNDNITISGCHIYRNILPWYVRARANIISNEIYSNNVGIGGPNLTGTVGTEGTIYIEGNILHHNSYAGIGLNIQSSTYFTGAEIVRNDSYSNGVGGRGAGIRIRYADGLKVRENRFHNNDRGIWLERIKNAEIDNNDVYQNQRGVL
ncbi:MAG: right-handed parallel beta-helix repeat-containing protein, partial [Deltaproteobacteria bacterium]|nr:right-handed parallel beta-helix repeat-containing protein [Deltaproteobacteria bacterium]